MCYLYESQTLGKTDQEEKESHISVMHSGRGKLSRINDAHDQKLSDSMHPR